MPRISRMIISDKQAVYHIISRKALPEFPMLDAGCDFLLEHIKRFSRLSFTEILGFCLMGNHFRLLVKMLPESDFSDAAVKKRIEDFHGDDTVLSTGRLTYFKEKLSNISEFMRDIKVNFTRFYNRRHKRQGYFWTAKRPESDHHFGHHRH